MLSDNCSVVILAGGASRRMGIPKAWLKFAGRPLLAHLVERMAGAFPEVVVVTAPGADLPSTPARVVYDEYPGEGPLAGVLAGLSEVSRPLAFVASCDLPFLDPRVAARLANCATSIHRTVPSPDDAYPPDVVVPEWGGRLHPLHAIYRTGAYPLFAERFQNGCRRMTELLRSVTTLTIPEETLREWDPDGRSLLNVNTPSEYAEALQRWEDAGRKS